MSEPCTIRALTKEDLPMILGWRNHIAVRSYMLTQHEINLQEHCNWFESVQNDTTRQQLLVLVGGFPIGFVQFNSVCEDSVAVWGFYLRPDAPKGSGMKLGQAALNYAFKTLRVQKVCGQIIQNNLASVAFHKKLGFTQEDHLFEPIKIGERNYSIICFGLLAKDWLENN